jgi:hypothetical protein
MGYNGLRLLPINPLRGTSSSGSSILVSKALTIEMSS